MKTPEQWHHTITDAESSAFGGPGWMLRFIAAIQSDAREGMVPVAKLLPTIELLLGATCRLGFTNPETQEGKDLWALRAKLHQEATRLETLLKTHAKE